MVTKGDNERRDAVLRQDGRVGIVLRSQTKGGRGKKSSEQGFGTGITRQEKITALGKVVTQTALMDCRNRQKNSTTMGRVILKSM